MVTFVRPISVPVLKFQNIIRFQFCGIQTKFFEGKNSKKMSHRQITNILFFNHNVIFPINFKSVIFLSFIYQKCFFFPFWIHNLTISLTLFERFTYRRCFPLFTLSVLPLHCRCSSLPTIR